MATRYTNTPALRKLYALIHLIGFCSSSPKEQKSVEQTNVRPQTATVPYYLFFYLNFSQLIIFSHLLFVCEIVAFLFAYHTHARARARRINNNPKNSTLAMTFFRFESSSFVLCSSKCDRTLWPIRTAGLG